MDGFIVQMVFVLDRPRLGFPDLYPAVFMAGCECSAAGRRHDRLDAIGKFSAALSGPTFQIPEHQFFLTGDDQMVVIDPDGRPDARSPARFLHPKS